MKGLTLTDRAADAIRKICIKDRLAPTATWEQFQSGGGQWILGFHSIDKMADGFLACDVVEVNGVSIVIDGPIASRDSLVSSELDLVDGQFRFKQI